MLNIATLILIRLSQIFKGLWVRSELSFVPTKGTHIPLFSIRKQKKVSRHNANAFLIWLNSELKFGASSYNQPDSMIHFVPQGILLRTPQLLLQFLERHSLIKSSKRHQKPLKEPFRVLQQELQKSGHFLKNHAEKTFFYRYELNSYTSNKYVTFYLLKRSSIDLIIEPDLSTCVRLIKTIEPS